MASIEEKVEDLLKEKINNLGYDLYDVQYVKEGKDYYLRIFIDKKSGIDLDDCEKVSNEINSVLDDANYITDAYFLEVSSPGIERILRKDEHLESNIGNLIELKLFKKINDTKVLQGYLINFDSDHITINVNNEDIQVDRKDISHIKTVYNW